MAPDEPNLQLVDELLGALGLKSVTTAPAEGAGEEVTDLARTDIRGLSFYSTKNREIMLEGLGRGPSPRTLAELHANLTRLAETNRSEELAVILAATQKVLEGNAEIGLEEFARPTY